MRIPARLEQSAWARARWLVLSPHPDDETLGAGALIAQAAGAGRLAGVAYLTAGEASHPPGPSGLAAARRAEAASALTRLTGANPFITWIGWPDARPLSPDDPRYRRDANCLAVVLRRRRVQAIAVTAATEPHCDHVAAYRFAWVAAALSQRRIAVLEYFVWSKPTADGGCVVRTRNMPMRLRRRALQAHRSQLSARFGPGFRLPIDKTRMARFDTLRQRPRSSS